MKKRATALTLAVMLLVLMLSACGAKTPDSSNAPDSKPAQTEGTEYPVVKWAYIRGFTDTTETEPLVEAALNEILRETANAEIDLIPIDFSSMQTQLNLLLTGSADSIDVFSSFWYANLSTLVANGQVAPLDELLATEGAAILDLFKDSPELMKCSQIDGKTYAIPTVAPYSSPMFYVMKKTDSDNASIDWSKVNTLDQLTDALITAKNANPDHYYIPGATETYWMPKDIDYLSDTNFLGVLTDPLNSTTLENYYESDYFMNLIENIKIWQEHDIISPDAMSNSNPTLMSIQNGITEGSPGYAWDVDEWCYEADLSMQYGDEMVGAQIGDRIITTGNVTTYLYHITSFSKNKEAAMRVLKEMYTNPECSNLFGNGIEGVNYVVKEDGSLGFLDGQDTTSNGWSTAMYSHPNASITPLRDNQPPNMWEMMEQSNDDAKPSLALGFTFNADPVADQVTACSNVLAQYYLPILNGEVDIDEVLPLMQQELVKAGIDTVIAEKQAQLDAWLAEN